MCAFLTDGEIAEALGQEEVSDEVRAAFIRIKRQLTEWIMPNRVKEEDAALFKQASLLQYAFMQTEEYKTASFKSFRVGKFSGVKRDEGGLNAKISPDVRALLMPRGYLYRGLTAENGSCGL